MSEILCPLGRGVGRFWLDLESVVFGSLPYGGSFEEVWNEVLGDSPIEQGHDRPPFKTCQYQSEQCSDSLTMIGCVLTCKQCLSAHLISAVL